MAISLPHLNVKKFLAFFFIGCSLTGCLSTFTQQTNNLLQQTAYASADYYRNQMQTATNHTSRNDFALLTVQALIRENKLAQAESLLTSLTNLNTPEQMLEKNLLNAALAAAQTHNQLAQNLLSDIPFNQLTPIQQSRYYQIDSQIKLNQGNYIKAIEALIKRQSLTTDLAQKQQNNDQIWAILRQIPADQLNNITVNDNQLELQGWLDLIKLYNDNLSYPAQLSASLQQWKVIHPRHIATYLLPTALQRVATFQTSNLHQIALILPLSGNGQLIGKTIEQGFLAAKGNSPISVKIYDSQQGNIIQIIEKARQEGAEAIVGPLLKTNVDIMLQRANLKQLKVLALNTSTTPQTKTNLCYFALSPEDEAINAAQQIWQDGRRTPLIFAPQNTLGRRIAIAFNNEWRKLSGYDAETNYYENDGNISDILAGILPPPPKNEDKNKVYIPVNITAPNDAIYAATANALQSQKLKTTLNNSVVADQITLYASSRSHSPNAGVDYRLGMNGVKFSDIPLLSETDSHDYKTALMATNGDYSLTRLYAMGADAWSLINNLQAFQAIPDYHFNGFTGKLTANSACQIERKLTWYLYNNGTLKTIN
ncbi:penicillin-binding protein activator [Mergibacter septicus]|uniref:penicillin-binding protein activator n=1 Tax=Mergibacter septicus TaxID=221402 RepID=UPI0011793922|nr:penicillin-binding protein activator [Mergibacter septicus]AWX13291.1 penicillin-binding protein activator [Mergibacter septicus]